MQVAGAFSPCLKMAPEKVLLILLYAGYLIFALQNR